MLTSRPTRVCARRLYHCGSGAGRCGSWAAGIAKAMDATGTPYIIAFVIDDAGVVLDGTSLWDAVVQANSSALRHSDLDGSEQLQREDLGEWTEEMLRLNREYGMRILGGCCGTDDTYLLSLVRGRGG